MTSERSAHDSVLEVMVEHLEAATLEMFSDLEIGIRRSQAQSTALGTEEVDPFIVAVIGYVGDGVRGALTMMASVTTIRSWLERTGSEDADASDALGEFSNMLLGRLKSRLLSEGLTLQLTTPTTATGRHLRLSTPPTGSSWLSFEAPCGRLSIRLDAHFEAGFTLRESSSREGPPARAGEAILF